MPTPPSSLSSSRNTPNAMQAVSRPRYQPLSKNASRLNSTANERHTSVQAKNSNVQAGSARPPRSKVPGSRNVSMNRSTASSLYEVKAMNRDGMVRTPRTIRFKSLCR